MFCTFIAWSLINHHGLPYWGAFFLTLAIAFFGGVGVHRRRDPAARARGPEITVVMATIALLVILNGLAGWIWAPEVKFFASPFPLEVLHIGGVAMNVAGPRRDRRVARRASLIVFAFFRFTRLGLADARVRGRAGDEPAARHPRRR